MEPATSRPVHRRETPTPTEGIGVRNAGGDVWEQLWDDVWAEADPVADVAGELVGPARLWQRARSAVLLTVVAVLLGFVAAVAIGVAVIALFALLRSSVG